MKVRLNINCGYGRRGELVDIEGSMGPILVASGRATDPTAPPREPTATARPAASATPAAPPADNADDDTKAKGKPEAAKPPTATTKDA